MVERSAVNRNVVSSSLTRGAKKKISILTNLFFIFKIKKEREWDYEPIRADAFLSARQKEKSEHRYDEKTHTNIVEIYSSTPEEIAIYIRNVLVVIICLKIYVEILLEKVKKIKNFVQNME